MSGAHAPRGSDSEALRRVATLALLLVAVVLTSGSSCEGPRLEGAVGLLPVGDRLGVVIADGTVFELEDASGLTVVWTTDARTFGKREPLPAGTAHSAWRASRACDAVDRCVEATGRALLGGAADGALGQAVPATRAHLVDRAGGSCGGVETGSAAVSVVPATGELVVAYGPDGIAVRTEDGWERRAVSGAAPRPLSLRDGPGVLLELPRDLFAVVLGLSVGLWVAALRIGWSWARRTDRRPPWALLVLPAAIAVPLAPVGVFAALFGVPVELVGALGAVATLVGPLAVTGLWRPGPHASGLARALPRAAGVAVLPVLVWYAGLPVPWAPVEVTAGLLAAGTVLVLARPDPTAPAPEPATVEAV